MTRPILYSVAWIACLLWLALCWEIPDHGDGYGESMVDHG